MIQSSPISFGFSASCSCTFPLGRFEIIGGLTLATATAISNNHLKNIDISASLSAIYIAQLSFSLVVYPPVPEEAADYFCELLVQMRLMWSKDFELK